MKTSVMEVHDMLSVFSVDEVEKRLGEVPGVESVTVNHAAGNATVRYDETRLEVADIKSAVRQRGFDTDAPAAASAGGHEGHAASGATPAAPATPKPPVSPGSAPAADSARQDKASSAVAPGPAGASSATSAMQDKAAPDAASSATETGSKRLK